MRSRTDWNYTAERLTPATHYNYDQCIPRSMREVFFECLCGAFAATNKIPQERNDAQLR